MYQVLLKYEGVRPFFVITWPGITQFPISTFPIMRTFPIGMCLLLFYEFFYLLTYSLISNHDMYLQEAQGFNSTTKNNSMLKVLE